MEKKTNEIDTQNISDWYHTFWELYKHRACLYIALCKMVYEIDVEYMGFWNIIRAKVHNDWLDVWKDWGMFILQLERDGKQISYHLDLEYWDECDFAETKEKANKWDGHTSDDVLERLLNL